MQFFPAHAAVGSVTAPCSLPRNSWSRKGCPAMKNLYRPEGAENSRLWAFTVVSFLITALCCTTVIVFLDHQLVSARRSQAVNLAQTHLRSLSTNISQALSAAYALSALVRQGNGAIEDLDRLAGEMLQLYPGVGALQLYHLQRFQRTGSLPQVRRLRCVRFSSKAVPAFGPCGETQGNGRPYSTEITSFPLCNMRV